MPPRKKQLKRLLESDPELLHVQKEKRRDNLVFHFTFTSTEKGSPITIPVCGEMEPCACRTRLRQVNCPDCLKALDEFAAIDEYDDAVEKARGMLPNLIKPDPTIMREKHGHEPTRAAKLHAYAKSVLDGKSCQDPEELPLRMVGATPRTYFKTLYEIGLIDQDGELSGYSAEDIKNGHEPPVDTIEQ